MARNRIDVYISPAHESENYAYDNKSQANLEFTTRGSITRQQTPDFLCVHLRSI